MKRVTVVQIMSSVMLLAVMTSSGQAAIWSDGFESGLGNWTTWSESVSDPAPFETVTSFNGVNPHGGNYMALQKQTINGSNQKCQLVRTAGFAPSGDQGMLTAYVNIASSDTEVPANSMMVGAYDDAAGESLWLGYDRNNPKLYYRGSGYNQTYTNIDAQFHHWYKVEFVIGDSGTSLYVDDTFVVTYTSMTKIDAVKVAGTYWGSSPFPGILVDDVSFVPEPATICMIGIGACVLGFLRRR